MGFKSPLAYTSTFYFVCRKDGVERKYMMYEGEDTNTIDLLYTSETTERNGVKVIIPVKYNDRWDFETKIKEQLAYFENVYFELVGFDKDFKIHRAEHFQISELCTDSYLHVCLDDVYYPLDFNKLGIDRINIPVGLRFSLSDGIFPTPNRESLRYTEEAKETILNKIKLFSNYCINKYNETIVDSDDVISIINHYKLNSKHVDIIDKKIELNRLKQYSDVDYNVPKLNNVSKLDLEVLAKHSNYILNEYQLKYELFKNRFIDLDKRYWEKNIHFLNNEKYYIYSETFGNNKKFYLREILNSGKETFKFIKKTKSLKLFNKTGNRLPGNYESYYEILNLQKHPKEDWRTIIKEFQYIISKITENFINVDKIVIPKQWLDDRKKKRVSGGNGRTEKIEGDISCKVAEGLLKYVDGQSCKFVPVIYNLEKFYKRNNLTIYALHDDKDELDKLYNIKAKQKIELITVSQREYDKLETVKIHNLINYKTFMEGKNKPFKRIVTAYAISKLRNKFPNTFNQKHNLSKISTQLSNKLITLYNYESLNYNSGNHEVVNAMLDVATEYKLFDYEIYNLYEEVEKFLEKIPNIEVILKCMPKYGSNDDLFNVLKDLMKYYKIRINYENYNIKLNEESFEELTEETIKELV